MLKREESDVIFDDIDWRQFEELCYDLLLRSNYHSLVWRQGGGDQGRDIEAKKSSTNELIDVGDETWFVECKHHSKSLQIEDISNKIDWAKAERPDHFMLMTSSYLAPGTRAWIEKVKAQVEFKIHVIEGKALKQKILQAGLVDKYFLDEQQSKLKGIQRQWVNHDILPDEESFFHLYSTLDISKLSTVDLTFALFIFHQLNEKIENYCDSENLAMPTDTPVILALRTHKNYGYPIISEAELKQFHFSIPSPHYRSTTMSRSGTDILVFLLKETINTYQLLDVFLKRENKTLEVRISLRE